jgi:hypothetical protein
LEKQVIWQHPEQGMILMYLKSGGLYELGIWETSQHLLKDRRKPRKPVLRWPVAGPSGCMLTTSQQSGKQKITKIPWPKVSLTCVPLLY